MYDNINKKNNFWQQTTRCDRDLCIRKVSIKQKKHTIHTDSNSIILM